MEDTLSYQLYASRSRRHGALRRMAVTHRHGQQQAMMGSSAQNTAGNGNSTPSQPSLQQTMQPQQGVMGSTYDDLPLDPCEYDAIAREEAFIPSFEHACQHGPLSTVQSLVSSQTPPHPAHAPSFITALLLPFTLATSTLHATYFPLARPFSATPLTTSLTRPRTSRSPSSNFSSSTAGP